jgi:hypothetical protein
MCSYAKGSKQEVEVGRERRILGQRLAIAIIIYPPI